MRVYLPCGCKGIFTILNEALGHYQLSSVQVHRRSCKLSLWERLMSFAQLPFRPILKLDVCSYCGRKGGTIDHIHPQSEGGSTEWENLAGACADCNVKKGSKKLIFFLLENHAKSKARHSSLAN